MEYGLDTSALMRILTGEPQHLARKVGALVRRIIKSGGVIHVSDTVVAEAYFAFQQHYRKTKEEAIYGLETLSKTRGFRFSDGAKAALAQPNAARMSPGLVDRMIAADYSAQGLQTISCEKSFRRLPSAVVVSEKSDG